jgi:thiol-disulfide isomerase/thioredoxin
MRNVMRRTLLMGCFALVGCSGQQVEPTVTSEGTTNESPQQEVASEAAPASVKFESVEVEVANWDTIQAWVQQQRGKVVVIDLWSTMCLPCMKEFPKFVAMSQKYEGQIACASVSVDFIGGPDGVSDELVQRVTEFLVDSQSTMKNFVASDSDETVLGRVEAVSVPVSLVYDAEGNLHQMFAEGLGSGENGAFNYANDVQPVVEKLLTAEKE